MTESKQVLKLYTWRDHRIFKIEALHSGPKPSSLSTVRMRPVTVAVLVVVLCVALAAGGEENFKERQKRFIGGILKVAKTFKDRISGIAKDAGQAAKSALKKGYKFSSKTIQTQYESAEKTFKKVAPNLDFNKALSKMIPMIDSDFTQVLCKFTCNGAAKKVMGIDKNSDDSSALGEMGCGPLCSGGLAKLQDLAEG